MSGSVLKKKKSSIEYLNIGSTYKIGEGEDRLCLPHPLDSKKCIKVMKHPRAIKQMKSDMYWYQRFAADKQISWQMISKYHGRIDTNYGIGLVFDLVYDYNGEISKNLNYYLKLNDDTFNKQLPQHLQQLKEFLLSQEIIFRDLSADNILCQFHDEKNFTLVIIDGIGNNEFIPVSTYISFFAKRKIKRKWEKFSKGILER